MPVAVNSWLAPLAPHPGPPHEGEGEDTAAPVKILGGRYHLRSNRNPTGVANPPFGAPGRT